ncbi:MAG: hypothetical protein ACRDOD_24270, partial [Streptosporangiaceae bacterium]
PVADRAFQRADKADDRLWRPGRVSVADAIRAARETSLQQLLDGLRHTLALASRLLFRRVPELGGHPGRDLGGVPARSRQ